MNLAESTWVKADEAFKTTELAIVPSGAVEVYGRHLPLGSDGIVALNMSLRLAKRVKAIVVPLTPVGCSQSLMSFPGTLTVEQSSLKAYLTDICNSLIKHGTKRILFINGHAGNVPIIGEICRELVERGVPAAQIDWWRAVYATGKQFTESGDLANGHAAEVGTSILLALRPDLVELDAMVAEEPKRGLPGKYPEILQYERAYREISASGTVGDPRSGSKEKGEKLINAFLDRVEAFLRDWK